MEWLQGYTLWILVAAGLFLAASIDLAMYVSEQQSRRKRGYPLAKPPARIVVEATYAGVCLLAALVVVLAWTIPRAWKGVVLMFSEYWYLTWLLIALAPATLYLLAWRMQKKATAAKQPEEPLIKRMRNCAHTLAAIVVVMLLVPPLLVTWNGIKIAARSIWYVLWDLPLQINDLPPFNGDWPFVGYTLRWLIIIAVVVIVVAGAIQFISWLLTRRQKAAEPQARGAQGQARPSGQEAKVSGAAQAGPKIPRSWLILPWVTVPFQHGAGIYWWWFGRSGYFRSVGEGVSLKIPIFQIAEIIDRTEQDLFIETPQLPTGVIKTELITRDVATVDEAADRSAARLEEKRRPAVSGTLSYQVRMTATVRSGDGIKMILRAKPEYRDFRSQQLLGRFTDIISSRLKTALADLKFEDAFFVPPLVILLGHLNELIGEDKDSADTLLVGTKRWSRLTTDMTDPNLQVTYSGISPTGLREERPVNIFQINLNDSHQVLQAITKRPESLLRTLYDLGYKITNFSVKDVNPPTDLETALKSRVVAQITRDASYTKFISEKVDQAEAIAAGRNIQSRASVYDFDVNLETLEKAFKKAHPDKQFNPTFQELLWLQNFREDRRTRVLMGGRVTVIDVAGDSPIPTSFRPFFAALAPGGEGPSLTPGPEAPRGPMTR